MDVYDKIDEIVSMVESARSVPMSASCMINRGQLLDLLDELRQAFPEDVKRAELLLRDREAVIEEGREEAVRIVERGKAERERLVTESDVVRDARDEAARVLGAADTEIRQQRAELDDYCDAKLASFEVTLEKTLAAVRRGRDRLGDPHGFGRLTEEMDGQDSA
ncbi:MAG: hypothetical protein GEV07_21385 [Streptosporangiales bacterium]|nr:hypothetical protein [Streptosporangiales bacterium]